MRTSHSEAEEGRRVTLLLLGRLLLRRVLGQWLVLAVSPSVFATVIDGHQGTDAHRHGQDADENRVSGYVTGPVF